MVLHVLLTILKILGIIILCILGLILFLILIVLFVPVRYKSKGYLKEEKNVVAVVSWLLHLVHVKVEYNGTGVHTTIRICGFKINKSDKEKSKKTKKTKKKTEEKPIEVKETDSKVVISQNISGVSQENISATSGEEPKKEPFFIKINNKILSIIQTAKDKIQVIKDKIKAALNIKNKIVTWYEYFTDENNKAGMKFALSQAGVLLKHIKPTKLECDIEFGTGDPANTGQILGAMAPICSRYGESIKITPDFDNKVFRGEYYTRGRIMGIKLFVIAIRLYRHKQFMNFVKKLPK